MKDTVAIVLMMVGLAPMGAAAQQLEGDPKRGAEFYRACFACHSLEPGTHLTGPSLAGLWGRRAGTVEDFDRYSPGLKQADFSWDETTLNAWIADPAAMVPGTYMVFRGIDNEQARADLIAFLEVAMGPGGTKAVIERGLASAQAVQGQQPEPIASAASEAQVTAVRHCGDSYFVMTANGDETPFWEKNVRLKIDSRGSGPEPGKPVIVGAGMMGDRVSIVFSSVPEISRFVVEKC